MKKAKYILLGGIILIMLGLGIQVNAQDLDLSGIELPNMPTIDKPIKEMTKTEIQAIYNAQKPASMAKAEPIESTEPDLSGLASILNVIQEILQKIKNLF